MTQLATDAGALLGLRTPTDQWIDAFNRPDGPLGNGWTDGHDWDPDVFEPTGILSGAVVCADPTARSGTYVDYGEVADPGVTMYHGIGCAWRDFGVTTIRASYEWSGIWTEPTHTEGGPLLHVTPGTPEHGIGVWETIVGSAAVLAVATIANPPEDWGHPSNPVLDTAVVRHAEGQRRSVELRSNGTGVTCWLDGAQVRLATNGLSPVPIPANLVGSTLHGFCFDTHAVSVLEDIPTTPVCHALSFVT